LGLGLAFAFLACVAPSLERSRLQEVDELMYARVAQDAGWRGQVWPLRLDGRTFYEKPPLLIWLAAAAVELSGQPRAAWPYRLWPCLGAALAVGSLAAIGVLAGDPLAGILAALILALQGDFLFHARFFTFDTLFLGCVLASLGLALRAVERDETKNWAAAGVALAGAAAFKSWFVLALAPAFTVALWAALPPGRRLRPALALALPALGALAAWVSLYVFWEGWAFLGEEWSVNLVGRALGAVNERDPQGHAAYYLKWAAQAAPALLPWAGMAVGGLMPARFGSGDSGAQRRRIFSGFWVWTLAASWLAGLALVRAETINYLLPLEAALALAIAFSWREWARSWTGAAALALSTFSALEGSLGANGALFLALSGLALGMVWRLSSQTVPERKSKWAVLCAGLALLLVGALGVRDYRLLERPLDANADLAKKLEDHPARWSGERLEAFGRPTQAVDFYSDYRVHWNADLPGRRPVSACLVRSKEGWDFFGPLGKP
jgi:4-amino-4-deoxy-L-arabinose transferase-like glycosyltransferase